MLTKQTLQTHYIDARSTKPGAKTLIECLYELLEREYLEVICTFAEVSFMECPGPIVVRSVRVTGIVTSEEIDAFLKKNANGVEVNVMSF